MTALTKNWVRILLVLSLAINVFVLGAAATHWLNIGDRHMRGRAHPGLIVGLPSPRQLYGVLKEDERTILTEAWRPQRPRLEQHFRDLLAARQGVAQALAERPYRQADLADAFAQLRQRQMDLAAASQGVIIDLARQLDDDGRSRLAGLMRPRHKRAGDAPDRHDAPPPPPR